MMKAVMLLVKIAVMMMAPGSAPAPPEARGREPPFFFFFLDLSLDGRRVSPLVHGLHGGGRARAPPILDLSLFFLLFLRSRIPPFHRFFYIRRSVTLIGLKPSPRFFFSKISFLVAKEERQLPYWVPTRVQGAPPASWPPRAPSRVDFTSQKS